MNPETSNPVLIFILFMMGPTTTMFIACGIIAFFNREKKKEEPKIIYPFYRFNVRKFAEHSMIIELKKVNGPGARRMFITGEESISQKIIDMLAAKKNIFQREPQTMKTQEEIDTEVQKAKDELILENNIVQALSMKHSGKIETKNPYNYIGRMN